MGQEGLRQSAEERSCPFCGEVIKLVAVKCRFCGEWLSATPPYAGPTMLRRSEIHALLSSLVDRSLATVDEQTGRYELLESVRQYSGDRLVEQGEVPILRDRHLAHYTVVAEDADQRLTGPNQAQWLELLDAEHDNFRGALSWLPEEEKDRAARLCLALEKYWQRRGHFGEARRTLEATIGACTSIAPDLLGRLNASAGWFAYLQGDYAAAEEHHRDSLTLFISAQDTLGRSNALNNLGLVAQAKGDNAKAQKLFEESLKISEALGDEARRAARLSNLGLLYSQTGRLHEAAVMLQEALQIHRDIGDRFGEAACLCNLGELALQSADYEEAESLLQEAILLLEAAGGHTVQVFALVNLVEAEIGRGSLQEAHRLARKAFALCADLEMRSLVPALLESWARLSHRSGDTDIAEYAIVSADFLRDELQLPRSEREASHVRELESVLDGMRLAEARTRIAASHPADFAVTLARELSRPRTA